MNRYFEKFGKAIVAFSGGADSTAVLMLAAEYLGADNVVAVTMESPHIFWYQVENARKTASRLGVQWVSKKLNITDEFLENKPNRCYVCKREILKSITETAIEKGIEHIFDGTNIEDTKEYRPGMAALIEYGIVSPLLDNELGKEFVHKTIAPLIADGFVFPNDSCVATRINGIITKDRLRAVETAENGLRDEFDGIRMRLFDNPPRVLFKRPKALNAEQLRKLSTALKKAIP
ncbi:7-cyano-7-deazaguanine synthase [Geovibrio thiophilus]|uniref:7-cyano-7-deazaguanine synthase n=1 Tax=Geovibrio thiophilus TaxID=139438 RepID=UPI0013E30137|nr:7-cyano-7-deazaguanine synthase [Geovibrio thiophilus]